MVAVQLNKNPFAFPEFVISFAGVDVGTSPFSGIDVEKPI
jgi:hypothetical protein